MPLWLSTKGSKLIQLDTIKYEDNCVVDIRHFELDSLHISRLLNLHELMIDGPWKSADVIRL